MQNSVLERFLAKVERRGPDECWPWLAAKSPTGYGVFGWDERAAHRAAYRLLVGPIPDGLIIRHTCDNPSCVNPAHLLTGTTADNARDAMERHRNIRGDTHPNRKLSEAKVAEILKSDEPSAVLAARYGVSETVIQLVRRGRTWADVPRTGPGRRVGNAGSAHYAAKANYEMAEAVRASNEPNTVLAKRYGVSRTTIYRIRRGLWSPPAVA